MMNDEIEVQYSHVSEPLYKVFYVPHLHDLVRLSHARHHPHSIAYPITITLW